MGLSLNVFTPRETERYPDELEAGQPQALFKGIKMERLPVKTLDLLRQLEADYPDRIITKEISPYDQGYRNGVIDLIRHLKQLEQGE